ncbi:L-fuconolactone hydrolase [hydrothermal vent metagenome]|uniref:L-fuconolactone hydrolase n=1 Tax=hydrothermal vent metagenome TaxID=652676 RepID=A0A3B0TJ43_9ZZZZ
MPDFPIIDAHVHLYDIDGLSYGWLADVPAINRTHLIDDFDTARGHVDIEAFVFAEVAVDPGLHLREAAFAQELADADPRLAGMVAHVPVERGRAIEADLARLKTHATLRGIRRLIETEHNPGICLEPGFIEGVRLLPEHGLSFDICVKHWGMTYAIELVRRCPDVSFILDHIGKPDIGHGLRKPWWGQMRVLAGFPNVVVKLSGVVTEADRGNWKRGDLAPYIAHTIDCFGFDRVMFGSDWPVSTQTHAYPDWPAIIDEVIAGASETERRQLYRETANRTYRLGV